MTDIPIGQLTDQQKDRWAHGKVTLSVNTHVEKKKNKDSSFIATTWPLASTAIVYIIKIQLTFFSVLTFDLQHVNRALRVQEVSPAPLDRRAGMDRTERPGVRDHKVPREV